MGSGIKGLLLHARRAAQKRNQPVSTAHALLVMVQSGGLPGTVLRAAGLQESELLRCLPELEAEPGGALERAIERAGKLATASGRNPEALHLLLTISRDPRTAGAVCMRRSLVHRSRLEEEFLRVLPRKEAECLGLTPSGPAKRGRRTVLPRPARSEPVPSRTGTQRQVYSGETTQPRASAPRKARPSAHGTARKSKSREGRRSGVQDSVNRVLKPVSKALRSEPVAPPVQGSSLGPYGLDPEHAPFLSAVGRNLTQEAHEGRLDPLVGRAKELEQTLDVLLRRRSNNPLLVGPPGVGKTALVEGLAFRLVQDAACAPRLQNVKIIELSAGSLVSGTGVRGAVAERMKRIRDEVVHSNGQILLFIDELHNIVGGEGPDDIAQELKSSLARGELPCIGATTDAEYRRTIERDSALARRFSVIRIGEPSAEEALEIVSGLVPRYETHHAVRYEAGAAEFAVTLTQRYLPELHLPDKAIGVLDQAGARARRLGESEVGRGRIAEVVSERAGVPEARLSGRDHEALLGLESRLSMRIVGHQQSVARVAELLRLGAAGLRARGTLGVFLLLGQTGVGKTELAKAVAEEVFGKDGLVRLDMSEFSEAHSVARLVGSPPGYVGHQEGGQLTEAVRKRPYSLVLLDEIEKAHIEVLLALLPALDEGRMTDSHGRTVDFRNTIICLTSNLGGEVSSAGGAIGFSSGGPCNDVDHRAVSEVRAALPPEFFNRIDEPLYFGPLDESELQEVARRLLKQTADRLRSERGIELRADPSSVAALFAIEGIDKKLGARPIRRAITRQVEVPLANRILQDNLQAGDQVHLHGQDGQLVFS